MSLSEKRGDPGRDGLRMGEEEEVPAARNDLERASGRRRAMIRALTSGMIGSSSAARMKTGSFRR
jgi:hypothetical protein